MNHRRKPWLAAVLAIVALATFGSVAHAQATPVPFAPESQLSPQSEFSPRVPVSALARPAAWFDPQRLNISTSVTVGSGWSGGTDALQVTSFSYRFAKPVWMNVSIGNSWGSSGARGGNAMFLEGLDLGFRPFSSMQVQVHYRDVRSPLQYNQYNNPYYNPYYRWGE